MSAVPSSLAISPNDTQRRATEFTLDGHSLIAVGQDEDADTYGEHLALVGRIIFSGHRYRVYDAEAVTDGVGGPPAAEVLTRRELQIAMLIGDGRSDKEIAQQLGISGYTVREHIRRIFAKLKIGRRAAIVSYVLRQRAGALF